MREIIIDASHKEKLTLFITSCTSDESALLLSHFASCFPSGCLINKQIVVLHGWNLLLTADYIETAVLLANLEILRNVTKVTITQLDPREELWEGLFDEPLKIIKDILIIKMPR